jgi:hypothetical protein
MREMIIGKAGFSEISFPDFKRMQKRADKGKKRESESRCIAEYEQFVNRLTFCCAYAILIAFNEYTDSG